MRSKSTSVRPGKKAEPVEMMNNDDSVYAQKMADILEAEPTRGPPYEAIQLCCHVFIGSQRNANDVGYLRRLGITHVLNCAGVRGLDPRRSPYSRESGIDGYLVIPAEDYEHFDIGRYFGQTNEFLDEVKRMGGMALVHCNLGINRSGAVCAAYLMHSQRMTLLRVAQLLKNKRSLVLCNRGFRRQLIAFARHNNLLDPLNGTKTTAAASARLTFEDDSSAVTRRPLIMTLPRASTNKQLNGTSSSSNNNNSNNSSSSNSGCGADINGRSHSNVTDRINDSMYKTDSTKTDNILCRSSEPQPEQSKRRRLPSIQPDLDPIHEGLSLRSAVVGLINKSLTLPAQSKPDSNNDRVSRNIHEHQSQEQLQPQQTLQLQQQQQQQQQHQQQQQQQHQQQQQQQHQQQQQQQQHQQQHQQRRLQLQHQQQQRTHHRAVSAGAVITTAPSPPTEHHQQQQQNIIAMSKQHQQSRAVEDVRQNHDDINNVDAATASTCRPLRVYRRSATDTKVYQRPQVVMTSNSYRRTETAPASSITQALGAMSVNDNETNPSDGHKSNTTDKSKTRSQKSPFQRISSIGLFQRFMSEPTN